MDQRAIDMQQSNTCGELMLADLSALVPKPVLLCAKDRANLCQRPRNCGGVIVLALRQVKKNFRFSNTVNGLRQISGSRTVADELALNGWSEGLNRSLWVFFSTARVNA